MRLDLDQSFDACNIAISPDDNYKIFHFGADYAKIAGKYLGDQFRNDPERPPDALLKWHFRQAILTNMKGAGEPRFEHDFPPGSDMLGEIREGPKPAERMGFELFSRVGIVTPRILNANLNRGLVLRDDLDLPLNLCRWTKKNC